MKPLVHPEIVDVPVQMILHALADPVRAAIFADIVKQDHTQNCSSFLTVGEKTIPKSTLSQHFKVLREAGLIRSVRRGVEMQNESRCSEVDCHYPGLLATIARAHEIQNAAQEKAVKRAGKQGKRR